jgi:PadR family transcriptional regulator, regulatory protein AphA
MKGKSIRLTSTSFAVLSLLDLLGEATPYDLKQALERSIENFWPVPHTTFYAEPARLAGGGLLSEQQEAGGRRRKLYALTDQGRDALRAWARTPGAAPPQMRDEGMLKIFAGADPRPIFEGRSEWHRAKLTELEGYLENLGDDDAWQGARASLIAGVTYHRQMLAPIERFLAETAAEGQVAAEGQAATGTSPVSFSG